VDLSKDFIGKPTLQKVHDAGQARTVVGLDVDGKRIARHGAKVLANGEAIGVVTSGTQSPTLGRNLAMALIATKHAGEGNTLQIDIRGHIANAKIVPLPFYKRSAK